MTILITGSSGLIGHALREFRDLSTETIIGVDSVRSPIPEAPKRRFIEVIGDLTDQSLLDAVIDKHKPRAVIHLAALSRVSSNPDPVAAAAFIGVNMLMTSTVLNAVARANYGAYPMPHVVVAGSAAEYGDVPVDAEPPKESAPLRPEGPYAISKMMTSLAAIGFMNRYPVPVSVLRFGNVYGPSHLGERFIPNILNNALRGKPTPLAWLGIPSRSYVYAHDVCHAITASLYRGTGGLFNITDALEISNSELVIKVLKILQHHGPDSVRSRPLESLIETRQGGGGARRVAMDVSKARNVLGWEATTPLETGLVNTVQRFIKENGFEVRAA